MSRDVIRLQIEDLSQFAKTLRAELRDPPGHLEMLGIVSRAAGYRNFQHLRARNTPTPKADSKQVTRAARYFDDLGRMASWPRRTGVQALCVWVIWAQLPPRTPMSERQISERINALTAFRDAAQIRRTMIENRLFRRDLDGSNYMRQEQPVPPEARALISQVIGRA